ncbi:Hyaluronan synthase 2 [Paramyrothecium foliicola]|nr:Hyaluronan synthase 2 [Paramyrothecium foliicola]
MDSDISEQMRFPIQGPPHVSSIRRVLNAVGCLLAFPIFWVTTVGSRWPVTLDLIITIILTELNRFNNQRRRAKLHNQQTQVSKKTDIETAMSDTQSPNINLQSMAAVVGWREHPPVFKQALESYRAAKGCAFVLIGIDGDEEEDIDMVRVFEEVFPEQSRVLHVLDPLGEIAHGVRDKNFSIRQDQGECDDIALQHCIRLAKAILQQENIQFWGPDRVRYLCIRQRHLHKKAIMFTTFIFSIVIADILDIEFLWSSDSDTFVRPNTIEDTISTIAVDPKIGGASSGLILHNEDQTIFTKLASVVYWSELYLSRSMPAPTATSDCQSGPSTLFRINALPPILLPWYLQTLFGKRMIINEDRHLTTNLLARGWGVVFASDVLSITDTPVTLSGWLKQQVRWARATHIESIFQPRVYYMSHPLLFWAAVRREAFPLLGAVAVTFYFLTAKQITRLFLHDMIARYILSSTYNLLRNPDRLKYSSYRWIVPGILFYHIPLPAIHVWSLMTLSADGWGTSMRSSAERAKRHGMWQSWWDVGFFVIWMAVLGGSTARFLGTHYELDPGYISMSVVFSSLALGLMVWWMIIHRAG